MHPVSARAAARWRPCCSGGGGRRTLRSPRRRLVLPSDFGRRWTSASQLSATRPSSTGTWISKQNKERAALKIHRKLNWRRDWPMNVDNGTRCNRHVGLREITSGARDLISTQHAGRHFDWINWQFFHRGISHWNPLSISVDEIFEKKSCEIVDGRKRQVPRRSCCVGYSTENGRPMQRCQIGCISYSTLFKNSRKKGKLQDKLFCVYELIQHSDRGIFHTMQRLISKLS